MESLSNPLVFSVLCAVIITITIYVFDQFQSTENKKDKGEYLRVLSFSGVVILLLSKLKSSQSNKSMKGGNNAEPPKNDIHIGKPGF